MPEFLGIQHDTSNGQHMYLSGFYIIFPTVIIVFQVCLLVGLSIVDGNLRVLLCVDSNIRYLVPNFIDDWVFITSLMFHIAG